MLDEVISDSPRRRRRSVHSSRLRRSTRRHIRSRQRLPNDESANSTYIVASPATARKAEDFSNEITDSEMIRFCDEIVAPVPTNTASRPKLLQEILDDFEMSPTQRTEPPPAPPSPTPTRPRTLTPEATTPTFRFASNPIRTYNRSRSQSQHRKRLACKLEDVYHSDSSNASDLSLQYDFSQLDGENAIAADAVDLNQALNLTENLLNLSSYFSQSNSEGKEDDVEIETNFHGFTNDEIEEACVFTQLRLGRSEGEDFHGFSDADVRETLHLTFQRSQLLNDTTTSDDCMDHIVEPTKAKVNLDICWDELLGNVDKMLEEADRHISFRNDIQKIEPENTIKNIKNELENTGNAISVDQIIRPSQLQDCESWTENDFAELKSSETDKHDYLNDLDCNEWNKEFSMIEKNEPSPSTSGYRADSRNLINISEKTHIKSKEFFQKNEMVYSGFTTASKKTISISKEAWEKANTLVAEVQMEYGTTIAPAEVTTVFKKPNAISKSNADGNKNRKNANLVQTGFTTGSKKPISISTKSLALAQRRLKEIEEDENVLKWTEPKNKGHLNNIEIMPTTDSRNSSKVTKESLHDIESDTNNAESSNEFAILSMETIEKASKILDEIECNENNVKWENEKVVCTGFQTASKKDIQISNDALEKAKKLVAEVELDAMPKETMKESSYQPLDIETVDTNVGLQGKSPVYTGFQTASKKNIKISKEALDKAQKLVAEVQLEDLPIETMNGSSNRLRSNVRFKGKSQIECAGFQTTVGETSNQLVTSDNIVNNVRLKEESKLVCPGFKTASNKNIVISKEALEKAEKLVAEVELEVLSKENVEEGINGLVEVETINKNVGLQKNINTICSGFQTGSKRDIYISQKSLEKAEKLVAEVQLNLIHMESIQEDTNRQKDNELNTYVGLQNELQTASNKNINISAEYLDKAKQLVAEVDLEAIQTEIVDEINNQMVENITIDNNIQLRERLLIATCSQVQSCYSETAKNRLIEIKPDSNHLEEDEEIEIDPASEKEMNIFNKSFEKVKRLFAEVNTNCNNTEDNSKRIKIDEIHIEETSPKRIVQRSVEDVRTPLNRIDNLKSTPVSGVIKRNRLSLSKRKKKQSSMVTTIVENNCIVTPIKAVCNSIPSGCTLSKGTESTITEAENQFDTPIKTAPRTLATETTTTPNLKEFFNSVPTSTPLLNKTNRPPIRIELSLTQEVSASTAALLEDELKSSNTVNTSGLQRINWEECQGHSYRNSNVTPARNSFNFTGMNVILTDPNPSPKTRIARLKIYPRPPLLSPILMKDNACRPCGLSRTRSSADKNA